MVERKKLLRVFGVISLALVLVVLTFIGACAKPGAVKPQEDVILVGGCGVGGTSYPQSVAIMKVINEFVPGYNAVAQVTGCSVENTRLVAERKVFIALISGSIGIDAAAGVGKFEGNPIILYNTAYTSTFPQWLMTLDPNIKTVQDFKGKRIAVGDPGSANEVITHKLLEAVGLTEPEDYEAVYLGESAAAGALRDGIVDAWSATGTTKQASIIELTTMEKTYFISLTQEEAEKAAAAIEGRIPAHIPAGIYEGQQELWAIEALPQLLATYQDADEDLLYTVIKAMWEHQDFMAETHATIADWDIAKQNLSFLDMGIPFNPGAIRYYEEVGVWTK